MPQQQVTVDAEMFERMVDIIRFMTETIPAALESDPIAKQYADTLKELVSYGEKLVVGPPFSIRRRDGLFFTAGMTPNNKVLKTIRFESHDEMIEFIYSNPAILSLFFVSKLEIGE
jgi:hypothetical protein